MTRNNLCIISISLIELSINQKTTAPPPYIHPAKREKYLDQQKKFHFLKNIWSVLFQLWYPTKDISLLTYAVFALF